MITPSDRERWVLTEAEGHLRLQPDREPLAGVRPDPVSSLTVARFRERFGSSRVAGTIVVSPASLDFRPRAERGSGTGGVSLAIQDLVGLEVERGLFGGRLVLYTAGGHVLAVGTRALRPLIEAVETVAGEARIRDAA